ncbi:Fe(3+)-hydroxamate ABC transporter permease FhuB [Insolitispirillum peregrinum]|uniref:Fe(3+)-hydroxamate ABC transporter permease FhuB n=1 Tax=Insolitispirillum peregrinum TaxID=80876 RepID=UPI0036227000
MLASLSLRGRDSRALLPALFLLLLLPALAMAVYGLNDRLPMREWPALLAPQTLPQIIASASLLPRSLAALLCGAALGLAGALFQHVLRNRMAAPETVGAAGGAQLALALTTLFAPSLLDGGRVWVAFGGGLIAVALVFALAWRQKLEPLPLILAGMIVTLYCGALGSALILMNEQYLVSLFVWGSGSLVQNDWSAIRLLAPMLAAGMMACLVLLRPLVLLELGDEAARSLGVPLFALRAAALAVAVFLSTAVISSIGLFGFIGLAGPTLASFAGARTLRQRLLWSPLLAMALLWLTDQTVQQIDRLLGDPLPTGAITALFGAPLILLLLPQMKAHGGLWQGTISVIRSAAPWRRVILLAMLVLAAAIVALCWGRGPQGWRWIGDLHELTPLLPWRLPRSAAALAAGGMLAAAGMILQRLTANPMASPEVLGITSGAAIGMISMLYVAPSAAGFTHVVAASAGALGVLLVILLLGRRSAFSPDRILLAGIALGALFDALTAVLTANGDPRAVILLNWTMGSTYRVDGAQATLTVGIAVVLLGLTPLISRWLTILPLGDGTSRSLGLSLGRTRLLLLIMTAAMTATATLVIGPLSFIGLMAPHLARMLGLHTVPSQMAGAILSGGLLMLAADWAGRMVLFPFQLPAGLMATLFGAPLVMWLLTRKR